MKRGGRLFLYPLGIQPLLTDPALMPYELPSDAVAGVVRTFKPPESVLPKRGASISTDDYLRSHSALLDAAVKSLAELAELPTDRLAIEAVGGFGRRELFPYSDIDLLVLLEDEAGEDPILAEHLSAFLSALWELGLTVGAAVRTRTEFTVEAGKDVSIATTYLESRLLLGSARLYYDAKDDFFAALDARAFFSRQNARTQAPASEVRRYALCARTQPEGISGRPSRSAGLSLVRSGRRFSRQRGGDAPRGSHYRARNAHHPAVLRIPENDPHRTSSACQTR